jgi:hypothetical protein
MFYHMRLGVWNFPLVYHVGVQQILDLGALGIRDAQPAYAF